VNNGAVIILCRNRRTLVARSSNGVRQRPCIAGVRILTVNDGSTDDSRQTLHNLLATCGDVEAHEHPHARGAKAARELQPSQSRLLREQIGTS